MNLPQPQLVDTEESLKACAATCSQSDAIAVDTEFMRTDTFYPLLGLIQISDGDSVWLIDPLPIEDFSALEDLFNNRNVTKIFHSCSEDLEVLRHQLGLVPTPIFDTQIAAAFLGYGHSRGYSALVDAVLDIKLEKHETRSDWLQRPLTPSQLQYAAEDVYFLIKVYRCLLPGLEDTGRRGWLAEDMDDLLTAAREPECGEEYYLRVKGAWKLSTAQLAVLRELTRWREQEARTKNRPRNRIISDKMFLDVIDAKPRSLADLSRIKGFHSGLVRRYGEKILAIAGEAADVNGLEKLPSPLDRSTRQLLADCRALVDQKAAALGLAAEVLARKKDLEELIRSAQQGRAALPEKLAQGWRHQIIGKDLYNHATHTVL